MRIPKIIILLILMAFGLKTNAQQTALHARALPYQGTWGVRILHTTAFDMANYDGTGVNAENFNVNAFMAQIDQLTSISHVMINLNRGHQASWYSAPYPAMEAVMGDEFFPNRDLFGELLDAIQARGLKALVYYSRLGFDRTYMGDPEDYPGVDQTEIRNRLIANQAAGITYPGAWDNWSAYRNANGNLSVAEGAAEIIEYYSLQYGNRIDGWWVDRCTNLTTAERTLFATACRSGNSNAIVTLQTNIYGSPMGQATQESDYTAGHPTPMNSQPPWTITGNTNGLEMVKDIEAGPWINMNEQPDPSEGTALGSIFMPFQRYWRDKGDPPTTDFPTDLAIEWTTRAVEADGMYIWAVERVGSVFAEPQFSQLLDINAAIGSGGPGGGDNLALNGTASQSTTLSGGVASRAIDGNTAGNFGGGSVTAAQGPNAWWEVDLGGNYNIDGINIFNRTDGCCINRLSDFTVSVINSSGATTYSQTITSVPTPSTSINAGGALGKVIRVQSNTIVTLNLAEVQVFEAENTKLDQTITFTDQSKQVGDPDFDPATASSGYNISYTSSNTAVATIVNGNIRIIGVGTSNITASQAGNVVYNPAPDVTRLLTVTETTPPTGGNLALNGTASQSTTAFGGEASRAIDGNTNGAWSGGSVTHTEPITNSYWQVDLGSSYTIDDINVFNRTDACCDDRLSDFTVIVIDDAGTFTFTQRITTIPSPSLTIDVGGVTGKIVRIRSNSVNTALSLAEVQVFGESGGGSGGPFVPDPSKTYYVDSPVWNLRLAASGSSEDAYTTSTSTTGNDVEWKFVDNGNGYWHMDRAAGGTKPRLRTDGTANADMNQTAANGANTYYEFTEGASSGTHFLTLPDGAPNFNRLQINNVGVVKMVSIASAGSWESFTITEASTGARLGANIKSINEEFSGFSIYPNPVLDQLTINIGESQAAKLDIVNSAGQIILSRNIQAGSTSIDLAQIPKGLYIIKVTDGQQVQTRKIIKK